MNFRVLKRTIPLLFTLAPLQVMAKDLIKIDGSSTVFPITAAIAEGFMKAEKGQTEVVVGITGTGGGFHKFCRGETDISNASRPIKDKEKEVCKQHGIEFIELPIGLDALTVVVNKDNDWVDSLTVQELQTAWHPDSEENVDRWNMINPAFPDRPLTLYGPGTDSGTYDYFVNAVVGEKYSRRDYNPNEDDNVIVEGVVNDVNAMAFFGLAYYEENKDMLKAVSISWQGSPPVYPSAYNASTGLYQPLSRPIFIYINKNSVNKRKTVDRFVRYYIDRNRTPNIVSEAGYVPLPTKAYDSVLNIYDARTTGSVLNGSQVGMGLEELLSNE